MLQQIGDDISTREQVEGGALRTPGPVDRWRGHAHAQIYSLIKANVCNGPGVTSLLSGAVAAASQSGVLLRRVEEAEAETRISSCWNQEARRSSRRQRDPLLNSDNNSLLWTSSGFPMGTGGASEVLSSGNWSSCLSQQLQVAASAAVFTVMW